MYCPGRVTENPVCTHCLEFREARDSCATSTCRLIRCSNSGDRRLILLFCYRNDNDFDGLVVEMCSTRCRAPFPFSKTSPRTSGRSTTATSKCDGRGLRLAGIYPINFCPLNRQRVPGPSAAPAASADPWIHPPHYRAPPDEAPSCSDRRDFTCRCVCLIMRG